MTSPAVNVLGLYSPSTNQAQYEAFIRAEIASRDPLNFSEAEIATLRRLGRGDGLAPLSPEDKDEIREQLERVLSSAVLIEVVVTGADQNFDLGDFQQPHPTLPEGHWQVAWDERFLSMDGTSVIAEGAPGAAPEDVDFRVVFYIHDWRPDQPLYTSYGPVPLPPIAPMPDRLWDLAPYREVD